MGFWKVELYSKFPSSSIATSTRRFGWNMNGNCHMKVVVRHLALLDFYMMERWKMGHFLLRLQGRRVYREEGDKVIWIGSKNGKILC